MEVRRHVRDGYNFYLRPSSGRVLNASQLASLERAQQCKLSHLNDLTCLGSTGKRLRGPIFSLALSLSHSGGLACALLLSGRKRLIKLPPKQATVNMKYKNIVGFPSTFRLGETRVESDNKRLVGIVCSATADIRADVSF